MRKELDRSAYQEMTPGRVTGPAAFEGEEFMERNNHLLNPEQSSICPVTGLPVTTRPEWTEIQLVSDYCVTFSIIGKAILLITPKGYPSEEGAKALLEKRTEVIKEAGLSDRNYVELRDYRMLSGSPPKGGRIFLIFFLLFFV